MTRMPVGSINEQNTWNTDDIIPAEVIDGLTDRGVNLDLVRAEITGTFYVHLDDDTEAAFGPDDEDDTWWTIARDGDIAADGPLSNILDWIASNTEK